MPSKDREHFARYTEQNRAKHQILTSYYPAYLTALKNLAARFHYVDAFAGRGKYEGSHPGSPLLALGALADARVINRSTISCVEKQADFAEELERALKESEVTPSLLLPPLVREGQFHRHVDEILTRPIYEGRGEVATFALVDPCGVEGVRLADLSRLLRLQYGEILLLFNYEGVNRLLGGLEKGTHDNAILVDLFGSKERVDHLRAQIKSRSDRRELLIRESFSAALKEDSGAKYFLPFRFKAKASNRPSHYLVHCSDSCLAFKIMKHVMWETGRTEQQKYGRLEFLDDRERGTVLQLLRPAIDEGKRKIEERVRKSPCRVSKFKRDWLCQPTDPFSEGVYGQMLLDLEDSRRIVVYDKQNRNRSPSTQRRTSRGKPTLGMDYWLRAP